MTDAIKQYRVVKMRAKAVSLVEKGAAAGSDAYLVQEAPQIVPDEQTDVEYPIVALVQEHLENLSEADDKRAAIEQILEVVEQDSVAAELAELRSAYPNWDLWSAFCSSYSDARSDEEKRGAIAQFSDILERELIVTGDALQQDATDTGEGETTTDEEVTQEQPAETNETTESTDETGTPNEATEITQESIQAMIQAALDPLKAELVQAQEDLLATEEKLDDATKIVEQQKVELAKEHSKNVPTSKQPDADLGTVVQSVETGEGSVYQGSHLDAFIKTRFQRTPMNQR